MALCIAWCVWSMPWAALESSASKPFTQLAPPGIDPGDDHKALLNILGIALLQRGGGGVIGAHRRPGVAVAPHSTTIQSGTGQDVSAGLHDRLRCQTQGWKIPAIDLHDTIVRTAVGVAVHAPRQKMGFMPGDGHEHLGIDPVGLRGVVKTLTTKGLGLNRLGLCQAHQERQGERYSPHRALRASSWA